MKTRSTALLIATGLFAFAGAPAAAQDVKTDVRCLIASNVFAKAATDEKVRQVASAAGFYYFGRLDGRLSADQLKAALAAEQGSINAANAGDTMNACARQVTERSKALETLGQQVSQNK